MSLYHASPTQFRPGDAILPRGHYNRGRHRGAMVFLHHRVAPHYTVQNDIWCSPSHTLYVYEVEPLGPVRWGDMWDEYYTLFPVFVRRLVRAIHAGKRRPPPLSTAEVERREAAADARWEKEMDSLFTTPPGRR